MHHRIRDDQSSQLITSPTLLANREVTLKQGHQFKAPIIINLKRLQYKTLHPELISYPMWMDLKAKTIKKYYQALEGKVMTTKN